MLLETEEVIGAPWRVASSSAAITRKVQHTSVTLACRELL